MVSKKVPKVLYKNFKNPPQKNPVIQVFHPLGHPFRKPKKTSEIQHDQKWWFGKGYSFKLISISGIYVKFQGSISLLPNI